MSLVEDFNYKPVDIMCDTKQGNTMKNRIAKFELIQTIVFYFILTIISLIVVGTVLEKCKINF